MRGVLMTGPEGGQYVHSRYRAGHPDLLPRVATTLPPELNIQPLADQAIFVRAAISGVIAKPSSPRASRA